MTLMIKKTRCLQKLKKNDFPLNGLKTKKYILLDLHSLKKMQWLTDSNDDANFP